MRSQLSGTTLGSVALPGRMDPVYENGEVRSLAEQLERARQRKKALEGAGASTTEVDREILDLRRRLREGGQLRAGDELEDGRYLLLERIGRGGFATVWAALDRERSERVAIKVLHPDQARELSRRERFVRGARLMAALEHAAVVQVLNPHGEDGGYHYFVMELVEGEDLHHAVLGGRVPKDETVPLILRVGEALAEAHAKGIVHRDVKPSNILLNASRAPRLTDFDLGTAEDTTGGTRTGAIGTYLFAAPEQIRLAKGADARADVYGLGMTMLFCLHGGDLPAIAIRRPDRTIDELACSRAIKVVLTTAIEVDPVDRYPDAAAFCEALRCATEPLAKPNLFAPTLSSAVQAPSGTSADNTNSLALLEGVWRDKLSGTIHYVRMVHGAPRCVYSFGNAGGKTLAEYYDWRRDGQILLAQFRWLNYPIKGFGHFRIVSNDRLEGGWSGIDAPRHPINWAWMLKVSTPVVWIREGTPYPIWAETYFAQL